MNGNGIRLLIQRVKSARVEVGGAVVGQIGGGLLVFVGIGNEVEQKDLDAMVHKLCGLRILSDENGKMNLSLEDTGGEVLLVSQFTLFASTKKGFRPSFTHAAKPEAGEHWYEQFCQAVELKLGKEKVHQGMFGAMMDVHLINDGPVTIWMDSRGG